MLGGWLKSAVKKAGTGAFKFVDANESERVKKIHLDSLFGTIRNNYQAKSNAQTSSFNSIE